MPISFLLLAPWVYHKYSLAILNTMHWILLTAITGAIANYKQGCCSNILNKATANFWQSTTTTTTKNPPQNKTTLPPSKEIQGWRRHFLSPPLRLQTFDCCGRLTVQQQQQLTCSHRQEAFLRSPQLPHSGLCDNAALRCVHQDKQKMFLSRDIKTAQKCGLDA